MSVCVAKTQKFLSDEVKLSSSADFIILIICTIMWMQV